MMNKNFIEERFPEDISSGAKGGPMYNTNISASVNGFETRQIRWQQALSKYDVSHAIKSSEQMEKLISFFRVCKGKALGFRFKDPIDNYVYKQVIGIGDGKKQQWQLIKEYSCENEKISREIYKPVPNSEAIRINGKSTKNYTLDYTTGLIKFNKPLAKGEVIEADFSFDVPVRFNMDYLVTTIESYGVYSWYEIPLIEIRL